MPISIRLGGQLEHRLNAVSRRLCVNKSEIVKRGLEAYLDQIEPGKNAYQLGEDLFGADASLIWLADRLNGTAVLTVDRRDFEVYRLSNGKAFQIVAE